MLVHVVAPSQAEFEHRKGADNPAAGLYRLVLAGKLPGLLAYVGGQAVGWCCVGLLVDFPRLERSRVLARVDARNVWSIVCFYIARGYRRQGLSIALARGRRWTSPTLAAPRSSRPIRLTAGRRVILIRMRTRALSEPSARLVSGK